MKYKITHTTTYQYSTPVSVCHNVVMISPRETPSGLCLSHRLNIRPLPQVSHRRTDVFGNLIHTFSIEESHRQLTITATSRVSAIERNLPAPESTETWESISARIADRTNPAWLDVVPFLFDSPRIARSAVFGEYARASFDTHPSILSAALDLTHRLHVDFKYDKKATDVNTPTEQAFEQRRGVCQDFAHIGVAACRSVGIPARYVSGYLRTIPPAGKPRQIGADASHAWISIYCGEALGWIDFDPTNDCICGSDHITVAWGRDYSDVVPIKGVFLGGGDPLLSVSVDVAPIEGES